MTYSIVAKDPVSGDLGVAVASRFFAVGSLIPHMLHNSATQQVDSVQFPSPPPYASQRSATMAENMVVERTRTLTADMATRSFRCRRHHT